jgi:hypothetical protein
VNPYLLDVVVRKSASILKLLAGEDQTLLVRGNALLVLNLRLYVINRVAGLDLESDGLAREGLDEAVAEIISTIVGNRGDSRSRVPGLTSAL